jgi:hypothetical protein
MEREIILKITVDWEDYDDVSDGLILEDVFESLVVKDGVKIEHLCSEGIPICPHCGSDKVYPTMAVHCNHCAMTSEI